MRCTGWAGVFVIVGIITFFILVAVDVLVTLRYQQGVPLLGQ